MWNGFAVERKVGINDPFTSFVTLIPVDSDISSATINRASVRDMLGPQFEKVPYTKLVPQPRTTLRDILALECSTPAGQAPTNSPATTTDSEEMLISKRGARATTRKRQVGNKLR